jgi:hypothetical protein
MTFSTAARVMGVLVRKRLLAANNGLNVAALAADAQTTEKSDR